MSAYYTIILIIGAITVSSKVKQLIESVKARNKEKISIDIFFLSLVLALIVSLIALK